jgi:glycosyltransferase involved in cell wall biosynthesis
LYPASNEEKTLERCLRQVPDIQDESLSLHIIIVDDCSTDNSLKIAEVPAKVNSEIAVLPGIKLDVIY